MLLCLLIQYYYRDVSVPVLSEMSCLAVTMIYSLSWCLCALVTEVKFSILLQLATGREASSQGGHAPKIDAEIQKHD